MLFNLYYVRTRPGAFKCIAAVLGLISVAFLSVTYDQARYYRNDHCDSVIKSNLDKDPPAYYGKTYEQLSSFTFSNCLLEYGDKGPLICPPNWLVSPSVFIIGVIWSLNLLLLVAMILVDFQKKLKTFPKIDYFATLISGGVVLFFSACLLAFVIWMVLQEYPCGGRRCGECEVLEYPDSGVESTTEGKPTGHQSQLIAGLPEHCAGCADKTELTFKPWHLIIGTVFGVLTGVLYVAAAKTGRKQGGVVRVTPEEPVMLDGEEEEIRRRQGSFDTASIWEDEVDPQPQLF